jgi:hypothetical protein
MREERVGFGRREEGGVIVQEAAVADSDCFEHVECETRTERGAANLALFEFFSVLSVSLW